MQNWWHLNARQHDSICYCHSLQLMQRFSIPVLAPPRSAYFACLSLVTHLIQIISLLEVRSMNCVPIDMLPTQGPLLPTQCPLLPAQGPLLPTQGPLLPTRGPLLPTQGPLLPTQGPLLPTQCPLLPTQGPLLPTPWAGKSAEVYFISEHSFMDLRCATSSRTDECDIIYLCKYIQF